jgi:acyl-CoA synthetase (AMP-forming)/AMP-acid ligase II
MKTIVVGVDGSEGSGDALKWAVTEAKLRGCSLRVVYSWQYPLYVTSEPIYMPPPDKDLIIKGGENISPREIEEAIYQHPAVAEAAVIGIPDADWGERLVALVRPRAGADGAALLTALEALTIPWRPAERPRRWRLCPALAPTVAGKWERARWRRWLEQG